MTPSIIRTLYNTSFYIGFAGFCGAMKYVFPGPDTSLIALSSFDVPHAVYWASVCLNWLLTAAFFLAYIATAISMLTMLVDSRSAICVIWGIPVFVLHLAHTNARHFAESHSYSIFVQFQLVEVAGIAIFLMLALMQFLISQTSVKRG